MLKPPAVQMAAFQILRTFRMFSVVRIKYTNHNKGHEVKINQIAGALKWFALVSAVLALPAKAATNYAFGSGSNTFSITFNAVNSSLEMGDTEVLIGDFNSYYYLTEGATYSDNVGRQASWSQCRVTGLQAVKMVNWLNTSAGGDSLVNWTRNSGAKFFLPTVAEWNLGLSGNHYAQGTCVYEWIQDTDGVGVALDGVQEGSQNKNWDDGLGSKYNDTGFRVSSNPSITVVPEPSSTLMLVGGVLGAFVRRSRI